MRLPLYQTAPSDPRRPALAALVARTLWRTSIARGAVTVWRVSVGGGHHGRRWRELRSLPAFKQFEKLVGEAKKAMSPLPSVCAEALYHHCCGRNLEWPNPFGNEDKIAAMKDAIDESFLLDEEEAGASVNEGDPKMSRSLEALRALERFLEKADGKFDAAYVEQFDHEPKFTSRRFWDEHL